MKQLSTKSVGSLLIATAIAIGGHGKRAADRHLERVLQRHDRKGDLRADILGMSALDFRDAQRHRSFDDIVRARGFRGREEFMIALRGRLRAELQQRGWSRQRINDFVDQKVLVTA